MPLKFETQVMRIPSSILQTSTTPHHQKSPLLTLPTELLLQIFSTSTLTPFDLASLSLTCHTLANFTTSFSLLTFTFHLPRHSFPDSPDLLSYESQLTAFLQRLERDFSSSTNTCTSETERLAFCPTCAKFLPKSKSYWDERALKYMVQSGGVEGGKWRRACQHFGGRYLLEGWIEKWCESEMDEQQERSDGEGHDDESEAKNGRLEATIRTPTTKKNGPDHQQQQQQPKPKKPKDKRTCPRCKVLASSC